MSYSSTLFPALDFTWGIFLSPVRLRSRLLLWNEWPIWAVCLGAYLPSLQSSFAFLLPFRLKFDRGLLAHIREQTKPVIYRPIALLAGLERLNWQAKWCSDLFRIATILIFGHRAICRIRCSNPLKRCCALVQDQV